jgi:hypothetical protein
VAVPLHPHKAHDGNEVADVQAARSRVEAVVAGDFLRGEDIARAGSGVVERVPPLKLFVNVCELVAHITLLNTEMSS